MKSLSEPAAHREIMSRLASVSPGDRALWGKMSAHQMLCHLNDAYLFSLGKRAVAELKAPLPRPVFKWLALRVPLRWRPGFPTPPELAQDQGGTAPSQFEQDRMALLASLSEFSTALPQPCLPHPYFGKMTAHDWMRWGYLHADHHLRQFGR